MPRTAFTKAQQREAAVAFITAVKLRDFKGVDRAATMPGFDANFPADVECVDWSEPGRPASAMLVAVDNTDTRMIRKIHGLGARVGIDHVGDDPLLVVCENLKPRAVPTLETLLQLDHAAKADTQRTSRALLHVVLHERSPKQALAKTDLLIAAGASALYGEPQLGDTPTLALARLGKQPGFAPVARRIAQALNAESRRLPTPARNALGMVNDFNNSPNRHMISV